MSTKNRIRCRSCKKKLNWAQAVGLVDTTKNPVKVKRAECPRCSEPIPIKDRRQALAMAQSALKDIGQNIESLAGPDHEAVFTEVKCEGYASSVISIWPKGLSGRERADDFDRAFVKGSAETTGSFTRPAFVGELEGTPLEGELATHVQVIFHQGLGKMARRPFIHAPLN